MTERLNIKLKATTKKREKITTSSIKDSDANDPLLLTRTFQSLIDTIKPTLPAALHNSSPDFQPTLSHLSKPLFKLVSLTTGRPHPYCPDSVLRYHLLTSAQLDDIARHYHQIWPPVPETYRYPKPIKAWIGTEEEHTIDPEEKRERIGAFIGLRRDTMISASTITAAAAAAAAGVKKMTEEKDQSAHIAENDEREAEGENVVKVICEGIRAQMQKDWEEALEQARRDEGYSGIVRLTKT